MIRDDPACSNPALTLSTELAMGLRDRSGTVNAVLAIVVAAYLVSFLVSRILEHSSRRMVKTYDLRTDDDCKRARASMKATTEPSCWLAVFLFALGLGLIPLGTDNAQAAMAAVLATGVVLTGISAWVWWRTTGTFMQFLYDFRKFAPEK